MKKTKFQTLLENVPEETKKFVQKQNEIASQIAKTLKRKGIKQKEFSNAIGMKESQLSKILSGNANLTIKTIAKIETALCEDIINIPLFTKQEKECVIEKVHIIYFDEYCSMKWSENLHTMPTEAGYHPQIQFQKIGYQKLGVES